MSFRSTFRSSLIDYLTPTTTTGADWSIFTEHRILKENRKNNIGFTMFSTRVIAMERILNDIHNFGRDLEEMCRDEIFDSYSLWNTIGGGEFIFTVENPGTTIGSIVSATPSGRITTASGSPDIIVGRVEHVDIDTDGSGKVNTTAKIRIGG